jgi:hypothetical protein
MQGMLWKRFRVFKIPYKGMGINPGSAREESTE